MDGFAHDRKPERWGRFAELCEKRPRLSKACGPVGALSDVHARLCETRAAAKAPSERGVGLLDRLRQHLAQDNASHAVPTTQLTRPDPTLRGV